MGLIRSYRFDGLIGDEALTVVVAGASTAAIASGSAYSGAGGLNITHATGANSYVHGPIANYAGCEWLSGTCLEVPDAGCERFLRFRIRVNTWPTSTSRDIVTLRQAAYNAYCGLYLSKDAANVCQLMYRDATGVVRPATTGTLTAGTWYDVVIGVRRSTADGATDGYATLWINGAEVVTVTGIDNYTEVTYGWAFMGTSSDSGVYNFDIDEIEVHNCNPLDAKYGAQPTDIAVVPGGATVAGVQYPTLDDAYDFIAGKSQTEWNAAGGYRLLCSAGELGPVTLTLPYVTPEPRAPLRIEATPASWHNGLYSLTQGAVITVSSDTGSAVYGIYSTNKPCIHIRGLRIVLPQAAHASGSSGINLSQTCGETVIEDCCFIQRSTGAHTYPVYWIWNVASANLVKSTSPRIRHNVIYGENQNSEYVYGMVVKILAEAAGIQLSADVEILGNSIGNCGRHSNSAGLHIEAYRTSTTARVTLTGRFQNNVILKAADAQGACVRGKLTNSSDATLRPIENWVKGRNAVSDTSLSTSWGVGYTSIDGFANLESVALAAVTNIASDLTPAASAALDQAGAIVPGRYTDALRNEYLLPPDLGALALNKRAIPAVSDVRYGVSVAEYTGTLCLPNAGTGDEAHFASGDASLVAASAQFGTANGTAGTAVLTEADVAAAVAALGTSLGEIAAILAVPVDCNVVQLNGKPTDGSDALNRPTLELAQLRCVCNVADEGAIHFTNAHAYGMGVSVAGNSPAVSILGTQDGVFIEGNTRYGLVIAGDVQDVRIVRGVVADAAGNDLSPTATEIADAVHDEALSGHTGAGTAGKAISDILEDTGTTLPAAISALQSNGVWVTSSANNSLLGYYTPNGTQNGQTLYYHVAPSAQTGVGANYPRIFFDGALWNLQFSATSGATNLQSATVDGTYSRIGQTVTAYATLVSAIASVVYGHALQQSARTSVEGVQVDLIDSVNTMSGLALASDVAAIAGVMPATVVASKADLASVDTTHCQLDSGDSTAMLVAAYLDQAISDPVTLPTTPPAGYGGSVITIGGTNINICD